MSPIIGLLLFPVVLALAYAPTWLLPPVDKNARLTRREITALYLLGFAAYLAFPRVSLGAEAIHLPLIGTAVLTAPVVVGLAGRWWIRYTLLTVMVFSAAIAAATFRSRELSLWTLADASVAFAVTCFCLSMVCFMLCSVIPGVWERRQGLARKKD